MKSLLILLTTSLLLQADYWYTDTNGAHQLYNTEIHGIFNAPKPTYDNKNIIHYTPDIEPHVPYNPRIENGIIAVEDNN